MQEQKENILKTFFLYPFRLIGWLFSALTMDEKGLSLKKCLAAFGTWVAYRITEEHCNDQTALWFCLMWLVWVLVVTGLYSAKDVNSLVSLIKGKTETNNQVTQTENDKTT